MTNFKRSYDVTRRTALLAGAASAAAVLLPEQAAFAKEEAQPPVFLPDRHGLSVFDDLQLPADFQSLPYVRVDAPKGGSIVQEAAGGTFNSFNNWILRGEAAHNIELIYDSLMVGSLDEPGALYGLVAKSVAHTQDGLVYRFTLRKEARFHDGSKLTARDVVFTLLTLRDKGHPILRQAYRDLATAEAPADDIVMIHFKPGRSREAPLLVAQQSILSAAYYSKHPFEESSLTPPLGSGPYKLGKFEAGRYVCYDRVADYWGRDLPISRGQSNFDLVRFEYFGDRTVGFEAFKAGVVTMHESFTASEWATGYDFPAVKNKRIIRTELPNARIPQIQGWIYNQRRDKFKDRRIRQALSLCMDFEWTNKNLMYNSYQRLTSYFERSPMMAVGAPGPEELALLEPFRAQLPPETFGPAVMPPVSDGSGQDRALLQKANQLLLEAGCKRDKNVLLTPDGKPFDIEFLDMSNALERHTAPFMKNLRLLGISANYRIVDPAQYKERLDHFDFDVFVHAFVMSNTPGDELLMMFGSETANTPGSANYSGLANPVVDALVNKAIVAQSREELTLLCMTLDRVLRANHYWTPHWFKRGHWYAYWDQFGAPERAPKYDVGVLGTWWFDESKAKKVAN